MREEWRPCVLIAEARGIKYLAEARVDPRHGYVSAGNWRLIHLLAADTAAWNNPLYGLIHKANHAAHPPIRFVYRSAPNVCPCDLVLISRLVVG